MTSSSGLPPYVLAARQRWQYGRQIIRAEHDSGSKGKRTVQSLSDLLDRVLEYLAAAVQLELQDDVSKQMALVLHGGCGRREFAPFSDVDLMLLHSGVLNDGIREYAKRLTQAITDTGLALGFSIRSTREATSLAQKDAQILSSLTESRFLAGNFELVKDFVQRLQRICERNQNSLVAAILKARDLERVQYGETVYLLRPNIKRSRGALRDVHLIRWLGFVRFRETDVDQLCRIRAISAADTAHIQSSTEFLLRVRCELHFHANRVQDGLGRNEQVRIAAKFGYEDGQGVMAVEAMMQDYFRFTSQIRHISDQFASMSGTHRTLAGLMLAPLLNRQVDQFFQVRQRHIGVIPSALQKVKSDVALILRLMQLAIEYGKDIEHQAWLAIREEMNSREVVLTEDLALQFMKLLENPRRLASILQLLHEMRVLEKIIPAFKNARGLLQFNEYHQFTVDEHTLQAVRECCELENDKSIAGQIYRNLENRGVLHLAVLLHDLGKGRIEDHCEVGREIAIEVCQQLRLNAEDSETVKFLVHNHLMMAHLAFHRDISDEAMVAEFAANVGSTQMLRNLFLLTLADIAAVGPGKLTPWKRDLLTALFLNAQAQLTGRIGEGVEDRRFHKLFGDIAKFGKSADACEWLANTARRLPWNYCREHTPEEIAEQLLTTRALGPHEVHCQMKPLGTGRLSELWIAKWERIRSGIFFKVNGLLASQGFTIHAAEIKPLGNSLLWYWFQLEDQDYAETPPHRREEIQNKVEQIALGLDQGIPRFRATWKSQGGLAEKLSQSPVRVEIDNQTVDTATIIDVFAHNRLGVLYVITRKLFELELDVQFARIATYGHQVLDVFYVTDGEGKKIQDRSRLLQIKSECEKELRAFLQVQEGTPISRISAQKG